MPSSFWSSLSPGAWRRGLLPCLASGLLVACGGGGGGGTAPGAGAAPAGAAASALASTAGSDISTADGAQRPKDLPTQPGQAARFLTQASFGPNDGDVSRLSSIGYRAWIDEQFALPATSHRAYWEAADAAIKAGNPTSAAGQDQVWESFWKQAVTGPDQLRQRVAYALSQVFVISGLDGNVGNQPRAMAAWLDMLGDKGLGNYRDLLEAVSLHPLMGLYLTSLKNQKPDLVSGRIPDQNFAREVMQLFSIGLVRLQPDGTPLRVDGKTVDTYGPDDVAGLSHVFTGFSWACPAAPANACFNNGSSGGVSDPDRYFKPMVGYPQYHSTAAKTFLGVTVPAQAVADPAASLKVALDTLAAHPNVGPFIGRQLIQRLVTSNPSPAYVQAVAAAFADNGRGQRGDMKAVVRTILTHPEALQPAARQGKVREPVLRLSAYLRAFPYASDSGQWRVGNTDNPASSLGQTPLRAPSVFNFYRPGYVAPGSQSAAAGLVAPEMQLLNETSVSGWVNFIRDAVDRGVGLTNTTLNGVVFNRRDLQRDWAPELALAGDPSALVSRFTVALLYGQTNKALEFEIATAVGTVNVPALNAAGSNQAAIDAAKLRRVKAAALLVLASPEFLTQK